MVAQSLVERLLNRIPGRPELHMFTILATHDYSYSLVVIWGSSCGNCLTKWNGKQPKPPNTVGCAVVCTWPPKSRWELNYQNHSCSFVFAERLPVSFGPGGRMNRKRVWSLSPGPRPHSSFSLGYLFSRPLVNPVSKQGPPCCQAMDWRLHHQLPLFWDLWLCNQTCCVYRSWSFSASVGCISI